MRSKVPYPRRIDRRKSSLLTTDRPTARPSWRRGFGPAVSVTQIPHGGEGTARNHGIGQAAASFIAFLDADDVWLNNKLTEQMGAFVADPSLDLVLAHVEHFVSPELDEGSIPKVQHLMRPMPGLLPSLVLRDDPRSTAPASSRASGSPARSSTGI